MFSVDKVSIRFGDRNLFDEVSFLVGEKDKLGLIGRNGTGKSTLLKVIKGEMLPDSGTVVVPDPENIGYLPQQMKTSDNTDLYREVKTAFKEIVQIEKRIGELNEIIASDTDYHSTEYLNHIQELTEKTERFHLLEGDKVDEKIELCLLGLGFTKDEFGKLTSQFSGGWRMRIELAKILLNNPALLLLDEPTNHLDIESIQWLENYLAGNSCATIIISHDRAFLDKVTNRTIEISLGKIYDFPLPYSKFVEHRAEMKAQQLASYKNQQKYIEDTKEFIERFRYKATKAVQVQSRIKQLSKLDIIEVEEDETKSIKISFPPPPRSGKEVVQISDLSKAYGEKSVLDQISLTIERGDRIAFVGKNGEGKTTLSRIIIGEIPASKGTCKTGYSVKIGYFAQNQDEIMKENKTVFETIDEVAVGDIRTKIRDILGSFLFSGEDVDKKVKVLSGGERSRLAMIKLLLEPSNLLILDEPTNHLDMRSKDILKEALLKYNGTLIVVSHDREFLDGLVNKVYEFKNKKLKEHLGGIYDFIRKRNIQSLQELERRSNSEKDNQDSKIKDQKEVFLLRKEHDRKIRKTKSSIQQSEDKIHQLEKELNLLNEKLVVEKDQQTDHSLYKKYEEYDKELKKEMTLWEKLNHELEKLMDERI